MTVPYWQLTSVSLGPLRVQVWGFFVAAGIAAAVALGRREAVRRGLDREKFVDLAAVTVFGSLVGARLGYALLYDISEFVAEPMRLVYIWDGGMSLVGGFIGAGLAAWLFLRRRLDDLLAYADASALYLPLGLAIGRLGCFFIHDHPGVLFPWFPAVNYLGGPRLDHGLLLSLLNLTVFILFLLVRRRLKRGHTLFGRKIAPGREPFMALFLIGWGCARFALDFLRAWDWVPSDTRLAWLTPAQYAAVVAVAAGFWLINRPSPTVLGRLIGLIRAKLRLKI
jgi:phosphatidylglycerol:prolipoprotein diacylglycerol transferase